MTLPAADDPAPARRESVPKRGPQVGGSAPSRLIDRRAWLAGAGAALVASSGCLQGDQAGEAGKANDFGRLDLVWGVHGIASERMHKPRAMAIDPRDHLYLVDFTARVLVYDTDGQFITSWHTPDSANGRPTGLTFDAEHDELLVADTHYYRVLAYTPDGELKEQRTLGGVNGKAPGEFGFVTDAVRDSTGCLYVSEYGDNDRVQKFSPDGDYLLQWGSHGTGELQFKRPQNLLVDAQDRVWVCDACNHRLKAFSPEGELLVSWGEEGSAPGQMYYPYDAMLDAAGDFYVSEYGNHRVQKFTAAGESLGVWGRQGSGPGELWSPWSLVLDSEGRLHILDTQNHRVQRVVV